MAKRTNREAWGLVAVLAVLLLGGAGLGLTRTYNIQPYFAWGYWSFSRESYGGANGFQFQIAALGPFAVMWWRRSP